MLGGHAFCFDNSGINGPNKAEGKVITTKNGGCISLTVALPNKRLECPESGIL